MRRLFPLICIFLIFASLALATDDTTIRTEIEIDWIDHTRFDIREDNTNIKIEVINKSNSEKLDNRIDLEHINSSNYNDFDRIIRIEFDADRTFSCSNSQIGNITESVDKLVNHCANYQQYINGTVQFADRYAEWMAEAAKQKEIVRQKESAVTDKDKELNSTKTQLTGCARDKDNYYSDWESCDKDYGECSRDLTDAKGSFAGKYLIGAVIGGIVMYIFSRKEGSVATEEEEFDEVD